ncbi:SUKH-4 family immunity protein [Nocardia brasiliensis]
MRSASGIPDSPGSAARELWAGRLVPISSPRLAALGGPAAEFLATAGLPTGFPFADCDYRVCAADELLAPISAPGQDCLALMHHEAGRTFAIDTASQEIWAVSTAPAPYDRPLFVNTDLARFIAYAGYMNRLVPQVHEISRRIPEAGEFTHLDRLLGLKELIVLLEDAQRVLGGWDEQALSNHGWWRSEFELWTVGAPGHGGLTIWFG